MTHQNHQNATYCPGGCMTALETLPTSEIVVTESGAVLCRPCHEAEEGYPTADTDSQGA